MQDIILALLLAKKPFKVPDTMQKKVPRYRQKVQIFKNTDDTASVQKSTVVQLYSIFPTSDDRDRIIIGMIEASIIVRQQSS